MPTTQQRRAWPPAMANRMALFPRCPAAVAGVATFAPCRVSKHGTENSCYETDLTASDWDIQLLSLFRAFACGCQWHHLVLRNWRRQVDRLPATAAILQQAGWVVCHLSHNSPSVPVLCRHDCSKSVQQVLHCLHLLPNDWHQRQDQPSLQRLCLCCALRLLATGEGSRAG